jgi:putative transposase
MEKYHRRSIRLRGYDYAQDGAYFVTICTHNREALFGDVIDHQMNLNQLGEIVWQQWQALPVHYPHIELDAFVVMPNHVHGIMVLMGNDVGAGVGAQERPSVITCGVGAGLRPAPTDTEIPSKIETNASLRQPIPKRHTLSEVVCAFKSFSARQINLQRQTVGGRCWQRNYFEHIIRNEQSLNAIRQYIELNPSNWLHDPDYALAVS